MEVLNEMHQVLTSVSTDQIRQSENRSFLIIKGFETLFWFYLFSWNWWNYFKYFTGMIFFYDLAYLYQWYTFVDTNGASGNFMTWFEFDKWFHLPFWVWFDFILFSGLEVADYYETNFYIWFIWVFPMLEYGWQNWYNGIEDDFKAYSGYTA